MYFLALPQWQSWFLRIFPISVSSSIPCDYSSNIEEGSERWAVPLACAYTTVLSPRRLNWLRVKLSIASIAPATDVHTRQKEARLERYTGSTACGDPRRCYGMALISDFISLLCSSAIAAGSIFNATPRNSCFFPESALMNRNVQGTALLL